MCRQLRDGFVLLNDDVEKKHRTARESEKKVEISLYDRKTDFHDFIDIDYASIKL